ncbi:hypothetical protein [Aquibacillus salsiterrae]|uniref:Uncharacterized protein n=1 Tax=Aquibacillus salsiterrae TaxID=2950439 RepID=A0A9X4AHX6_9BACI|nr:hypothetical protein [Aquibacillus salsiterrae]MDC3418703.1 hypothetical protein [Aquibacillus salsiterrae]
MVYIMITASQINEILFKCHLIEGKDRLLPYYNHFGCLEGIPVVEYMDNGEFRLITYYENYHFYKTYFPSVPFISDLKYFNNSDERYVELLNQLFNGKARSSKSDKYTIINEKIMYLTPKEIADACHVKYSTISKLIYDNDKYKAYLEQSMEVRANHTMEDLVNYIKRHKLFKSSAEIYLLKLTVDENYSNRLTHNDWKVIKWVLLGIQDKFKSLSANAQVELLKEMRDPGLKVLHNYFRNRCEEILTQTR